LHLYSDHLLPGQQAADRPDIVARVWNEKLKELLKDILERQILGKVIERIYSIEFQKRGLPHAHILVFLSELDKPHCPMDYDKFVCANVPDPDLEGDLYDLVAKHMLHGPCSRERCLDERTGICKKSFPKEFLASTVENADGYPVYKRVKQFVVLKQIKDNMLEFDSSMVVPYNRYLF
jgi:hypothetical protein